MLRTVITLRSSRDPTADEKGRWYGPLCHVVVRRSAHSVLPAVAWLFSCTGWEEARRTRVVALAATGYGLTIAVALAYSLLRM